jgi:hypothetical protein
MLSNLEILNRGRRATFFNRLREEVIDITFCSQKLVNVISGWEVIQEDTKSDHLEINFNLRIDHKPVEIFRNPKKTDWEIYRECLSRRSEKVQQTFNGFAELNKAVDELTHSLVSSYMDACPISKKKSKTKPPWLSPEIENLKKECSKAWNRRKVDWENFREKRREYKKAYRKASRLAWREFCESVETDSATARIHKILSKDRSDLVCALKMPNGEYTSDESSLLNHLLDVHFPGCKDPES